LYLRESAEFVMLQIRKKEKVESTRSISGNDLQERSRPRRASRRTL